MKVTFTMTTSELFQDGYTFGRYWVFIYSFYYPGGGMEDLAFMTNDLEKAKASLLAIEDHNYRGGHIFDAETGEVINAKTN